MAGNPPSPPGQIISAVQTHNRYDNKMMNNPNPRVEIDTSQPFESVKEAVTHFGGSGSWIPLHVLRFAASLPQNQHDAEEFDIDKVGKQAAELEKELIVKEQETLEVLKELEAAKRIVEGLKLNLVKEVSALMSRFNLSSDSRKAMPSENPEGSLSIYPVSSPSLILTELKEAKVNLNKTTNDLASIQASVENLNNKMRKSRDILEKKMEVSNLETKSVLVNSMTVSTDIQQFNFEAEQFKKMEEAATYEVMKATSEIEQTKTSIKMVEMRLTAAKKIEEAARAMEAVALAKINASDYSESSSEVIVQNPNQGITLSYEEYSALTQKVQQAEELSTNRNVDHNVTKLSKLAISTEEVKHSKKSLEEALRKVDGRGRSEHGEMRFSTQSSAKYKFRNSHSYHSQREDTHLLDGDKSDLMNDKSMPVLRSTISIGDILSRKLILQDDIMVEKHIESNSVRHHEMSLSQMLRDQSGLILHPPKAARNASVEKQFFAQRKKFGFIHVPLNFTKQSKKKSQAF